MISAIKSKAVTMCPGCGLVLPNEQGPVHRYLGSSPACWRLFGEVLSREYSDPQYRVVHRLTVDAYAAQHPGKESPQTIQTVALHLISLCLVLEDGYPLDKATRAIGQAARRKKEFWWLTPPASLGAITVREVHAANTPEEHGSVVRRWAETVWVAWAAHHDTVRRWTSR